MTTSQRSVSSHDESVELPRLPTIRTRLDGQVLHATFDAPPINLIGPEVVRDLVRLLDYLEHSTLVRVVVFASADPDFFFPHVDMTKVPEYTAEAAKAGGVDDASLGMLFHKLSQTRAITIVALRGRARGAGSEFALACDMRFADEHAVLGQPEVGIGGTPGAGGIQHLARMIGRGRAMEVILSSRDFDAVTAERYGWINRALPDSELDLFVDQLAQRMAGFSSEALCAAKTAINTVTLAAPADIRADAAEFQRLVKTPAVQERAAELFRRGFQTRGPVELQLGDALADLTPLDASLD